MAEDQAGLRKDPLKELAPWSRLFSAFKIALDPKKLLLAAAGILTMAIGWYVLAIVFFALVPSTPPKWGKDYEGYNDKDKKYVAWQSFKRDLQRWNLMYEMAGTPPLNKDGKPEPIKRDIGDEADSPDEFEGITKAKEYIDDALRRLDVKIKAKTVGAGLYLNFADIDLGIWLPNEEDRDKLIKDLNAEKWRVSDLRFETDADKKTKIVIGPYEGTPTDPTLKEVNKAKAYKAGAGSIFTIEQDAIDRFQNPDIVKKALALRQPRYKPYGMLRTMPWFEDRGPNPYLMATGNLRSNETGVSRYLPWDRGQFTSWLVGTQLPVLLEPLVKFFRPLVYLFDPAGGWLNRVYLFLVILWSLATWALFGGAITRIAAVQAARTNERVGLTESLRFVWARYKSYLSAPLFPLVFLAFIAVCLILFGFLEAWTGFVGDILMPLLFPLVLLAGLIMAVVLVGLVGYPLMYTTISAEGSDSFDAISRSYSYVYQAPWQYLWYALLALVYGAALVFFVGFMGSLLVYLSKWGIAEAPFIQSGREPSYLFAYAPTSYGWRDLLLHKSPHAKTELEVNNRGQEVPLRQINEVEGYQLSWNNKVAAFLTSVWLYLLFLLVVGFGYSYFWTASTIIYLLMRRKVDDTEMDEIHLEEEPEQPWTPPAPAAPPAGEPAKSNATPAQMVEPPAMRHPVDMPPAASPTVPVPPPEAPVAPPAAEPVKEPPPGEGLPPLGGTAP